MGTFFEEYKCLAKSDKSIFRREIMDLCKIAQSTFHQWIREERIPILPRKVISEYKGISEDILFPINKHNSYADTTSSNPRQR